MNKEVPQPEDPHLFRDPQVNKTDHTPHNVPSERVGDEDDFLFWMTTRLPAILRHHDSLRPSLPPSLRREVKARVRQELSLYDLTQRQQDVIFGRFFDGSIAASQHEWATIVHTFEHSEEERHPFSGHALLLHCMYERALLDGDSLLPQYTDGPQRLASFTATLHRMREEWCVEG